MGFRKKKHPEFQDAHGSNSFHVQGLEDTTSKTGMWGESKAGQSKMRGGTMNAHFLVAMDNLEECLKFRKCIN